jgi:hypothetical protein
MGNPVRVNKNNHLFAILLEDMKDKMSYVVHQTYRHSEEANIWNNLSEDETKYFINWFCLNQRTVDLCYYYAVFYEGNDTDNKTLSTALLNW